MNKSSFYVICLAFALIAPSFSLPVDKSQDIPDVDIANAIPEKDENGRTLSTIISLSTMPLQIVSHLAHRLGYFLDTSSHGLHSILPGHGHHGQVPVYTQVYTHPHPVKYREASDYIVDPNGSVSDIEIPLDDINESHARAMTDDGEWEAY